MNKGFIKISRCIFEHWIFQDAEKFRAFVDLIQLARWKDEKLIIGNEVVVIPRGSYYTSILKLAERWHWGRDKTRNFLTLLEKEQMISVKTTPKGTTLTIENYRLYQDEGTTNTTTNRQLTQQQSNNEPNNNQDNKHDTKEEIKEIKEIQEGKERKEKAQPLSFPSPIHEEISKHISEVAYKSWFSDSEIEETDKTITIKTDSFKSNVISSRYTAQLGIYLGKQILLEVKNG